LLIDGTSWVLNEIPDYQTELQKCLGYFYKTDTGTANIGIGFITSSSKKVMMVVQVPVPFVRPISKVSIADYTLRIGTSGYSVLTPNETYIAPEKLSVALPSKYTTSIRIIDERTNATGDTNNTIVAYAARGIEISCEP